MKMLIMLLCIIFKTNGEVQNSFVENNNNITWEKITTVLQFHSKKIVEHIMPSIKMNIENSNVSKGCQLSLFHYFESLKKLDLWALKMLDANGKIPSGILEGNILQFGSYDECVGIKVKSESSEEFFRGKHCIVKFTVPYLGPSYIKAPDGRPYSEVYGDQPDWVTDLYSSTRNVKKPENLWYGVCIPSLCSEEDVKNIADSFLRSLSIDVTVDECQIEEEHKWSSSECISVSLLLLLLCIVALGTTMDVLARRHKVDEPECKQYDSDESKLLLIVKAFSVCTNTENLLNTGSGGSSLQFISGIRFLSACVIVLGHTYIFSVTWIHPKALNQLKIIDLYTSSSLLARVVDNFTLAVGTFFFYSGFLVVYTNWKKLEKSRGRLNVLDFLLHKYWRLTPAFVFTLLLLFVMPLLGSGAIWKAHLQHFHVKNCENFWWTNLLYFNNIYTHAAEQCLGHSWFSGALMQLHIIACLFLILFFRRPVPAVLIAILLSILCCSLTYVLHAWNHFPMPALSIIYDAETIVRYLSIIYIMPFQHFTSYLIGMILGYIILKRPNVQLSKMQLAFGWALSVTIALIVFYGVSLDIKPSAVTAFYAALYRTGWAMFVAWLTLVCSSGYGGIINRFLSWNVFRPLGQLSYQIYLTHYLIIVFRYANSREQFYHSNANLIFEFVSVLVISCFISYFGYITVEAPFVKIEGILLSKRAQTQNLSEERKKVL